MKTFEIILGFIIIVLGLILSTKWKELSTPLKITLSILVILLVIVTIVQIKNSNNEKSKERLIEKISSNYGELEFDGEPVTAVMLGGSETSGSFYFSNGAGLIDKISGSSFLKMSIKDDKLLVNILIRDFNGEVIAVIDGDEWTVFDSDYEYNDDDGKAFELVTKGERKVFFQIEYKNELVHLSGHLLNEEGFGIVIFNPKNQKGSAILRYREKNQMKELKDIDIPRLFKYPRSKYYKVRL